MDGGSTRTCLARLPDGELRVLEGDQLDEIDELRSQPHHLVWVDILSPSAEDLALLVREFDLHPLALEDLEKRRQRAKIDTYPGQHVIVTYEVLPRPDDADGFELGEIHLFAGSGYLVSVRWDASPAIADVDRRFRQRTDAIGSTVGGLLYSVLDAVVDGYFPLLDRLSDRIDDLEEQIMSAPRGNDALRSVLGLKRKLLELRRVLAPQRDIANALLRRELPLVDDAAVPYFQNLYDHLVRVLESLDLYRDLVAAALEANLAVTSNNLNEVMKRLTAFTVVIMIPTLIAGIYGMNFHFMPELSWPLGYLFALGLMAAGMLGAAIYFRRNDWF
jgi:magnesium transporter